MANTINYATRFERDLKQKYKRESLTADLTTEKITFVNAKTVKIPYLELGGFKDHTRNGGFNRQNVKNDYMTKTLSHDRDVEFFVDTEDVDESNLAVAAANLTNTFEEEHAIPEEDCYRISKLYSDYTGLGKTADTTELTVKNILSKYDDYMEAMDEAEVPEEGRILYATPAVEKLLKNAEDVKRVFSLNAGNGNGFMRAVRSLDDVKIKKLPSSRMKTAYNFTDGCVPGASAEQLNMILVHPKSVLACDKHSYIKLWAPGTHTQGDGFLFQLRKYWDLFVVDTRVDGIMINKTAKATQTTTPTTPTQNG